MSKENLIEKLGIVILNYNDYSLTTKLVNLLLGDDYLCKAKIVIVDNVSINNSYENLKNIFNNKVDVIKSDFNGGYAYGNNFGIKFLLREHKEIEYIAICNPDTVIFADSVQRMLDVLNDNDKLKLLGCRAVDKLNNTAKYCWKMPSVWYEILSSEILINRLFLKNKLDYSSDELSADILYVDVVLGAFFIIKAETITQIDYLDEDTFLYCEEQILSKRIKDVSGDIAVLNQYTYIHNHKSISFKKQVESYRLHQKSKRVFLNKYTKFNLMQRCCFAFFTFMGTVERKIILLFKR